MSVEKNVKARYSEGAKEKQQALCCPVDYQSELLALLPEEIIERDYGCGDPSRYVHAGDTVLDLGSGGGKICYMAAQLVGETGHVHGVDMTDDMLQLARRHQQAMAAKIGEDRVTFHKGYIQNLALDLDAAAEFVERNPVTDAESLSAYETWKEQQQKEQPMIADGSVDLVISNCVLNLVDRKSRSQLFNEIYRVLKPGGRVAISDIVSDALVPESLQNDPELWSGCISGAFHEKAFLQAFVDAGFAHVTYDKWEQTPWQVVDGIEFRSVTLVATKPPVRTQQDQVDQLMYVGPYQSIADDLGNVFIRGERTPVSRDSYQLHQSSRARGEFIGFTEGEASEQGARHCAIDTPANSQPASSKGCCEPQPTCC